MGSAIAFAPDVGAWSFSIFSDGLKHICAVEKQADTQLFPSVYRSFCVFFSETGILAGRFSQTFPAIFVHFVHFFLLRPPSSIGSSSKFSRIV